MEFGDLSKRISCYELIASTLYRKPYCLTLNCQLKHLITVNQKLTRLHLLSDYSLFAYMEMRFSIWSSEIINQKTQLFVVYVKCNNAIGTDLVWKYRDDRVR